VFKSNVNVHHGRIGAGFLFDLRFQEAYLERGVDCHAYFPDGVPFVSRFKKAGIHSWCQLVKICQDQKSRKISLIQSSVVINVRGTSYIDPRLCRYFHRTGFTWAKDLE
jgi:hypothetical protein